MSDNPITFLIALADECERSDQEYGKGRAEGIRETLRELGPHTAARDATIADLREKLRVVGEALKQCEWGGTERDEDGAELEACPWCGEPKPEGITPDPLNGHFQECELFTALRAAGVGGEQK